MTYVATDLNRKITFRKLTLTQDPNTGEMIEAWADHVSVFARVEPLVGREYFAAMSEHAEVTTRIRIRYREDIDRTMRVVYANTEFEILHIIHPEFGRRELQLMCKERQ